MNSGDALSEFLSEGARNELLSKLQSAPPSIAFLGKLNLLATDQDFSLIEEGETCEYLTTPESFRACLTQITFAGLDAFQKAQMEKVMLNSQRIPGRCNLKFSMFDFRFVICNMCFVIFDL